jgi:glutathione synthase/RimK-type ligase-like ATP-grasp enzyme
LIATSGEYSGVPRIAGVLHRAGCRVDIVCPPRMTVASTRFITRAFVHREGPEGIAEALRSHLAAFRDHYDWVLVGDDPLLRAVVARRHEGWLAGWFPVDPSGDLPEMIVSKSSFMAVASQAGIPVPQWRTAQSAAAATAAAEEIGYPVVLKKAKSSAGEGVVRAGCSAHVVDAFARLASPEPVLVQQFLPYQAGVTEALFDHGRPTCWVSSYMLNCWPNNFSPSSARQVMDHPQVERILRTIGQTTGLHGFGGFDFLHDATTDDFRVIELHARTTPGVHLGRFGGVYFPAAVRALLAGRRHLQRPMPINNGPIISLFPQDLERVVESGDWHSLCRTPFTASAWRDIPWSDPALLLACAQRVATAAVKGLARHLIRRLRRAGGPGRPGSNGATAHVAARSILTNGDPWPAASTAHRPA